MEKMEKDFIMEGERYVGVVFDAWLDGTFDEGLNAYTYICSFDVEAGDIVLVETVNGLKVGTIVEVGIVPIKKYSGLTKEVVAIFYPQNFLDRKEFKKQVARLEYELEQEIIKAQKEAKLLELAKDSPSLLQKIEHIKTLKEIYKNGEY